MIHENSDWVAPDWTRTRALPTAEMQSRHFLYSFWNVKGGIVVRIFLFIIALQFTACQRHTPAENLLDDYLIRLARVLDLPKPNVAKPPPLTLPAPRDLQVVVEPVSIDLLDYWAFRTCGLAPLLGERNSVLGRVMRPSQAMHMDGRLLRQLAYCERELEDEEMLALTRKLIIQKHRQWPQRYWNATIAAPELRQFWSPATVPLAPGADTSYRAAEAALKFLAALPDRLYSEDWPDVSTLEGHYQQLESYRLGGKLLQSLQLGHTYLVSANHLLRSAIKQNTLCPYQLQRRELAYARNVMTLIFAGEVQPWLATLNRHANALLADYDQLIDAQAAELQPRIAPHQRSLHQLFEKFRNANRDHVKYWKILFENCGSNAIPSKHTER